MFADAIFIDTPSNEMSQNRSKYPERPEARQEIRTLPHPFFMMRCSSYPSPTRGGLGRGEMNPLSPHLASPTRGEEFYSERTGAKHFIISFSSTCSLFPQEREGYPYSNLFRAPRTRCRSPERCFQNPFDKDNPSRRFLKLRLFFS